MAGFEVVQEGANKLWVNTPFPVTQNVWGYFVKDIFPQFSIDWRLKDVLEEEFSWPDSGVRKRWEEQVHRYLLKKEIMMEQ